MKYIFGLFILIGIFLLTFCLSQACSAYFMAESSRANFQTKMDKNVLGKAAQKSNNLVNKQLAYPVSKTNYASKPDEMVSHFQLMKFSWVFIGLMISIFGAVLLLVGIKGFSVQGKKISSQGIYLMSSEAK